MPCKTCTYSCVYCQLGPTDKKCIDRYAYFESGTIVKAIEARMKKSLIHPDFISFIGCGEPTLASNMGQTLKKIRKLWDIQTALITNGSLFWKSDVRYEGMSFDVVMPTIAAGNPNLFRKIHRPHKELIFSDVVDGLVEFSKLYNGRLLPEVMLLRDRNDNIETLEEIREILCEMDVEEVHITAPIRPPSESWVQVPSRRAVDLALEMLPKSIDFTKVRKSPVSDLIKSDIEDLLAIATMHPLKEDQAISMLRKNDTLRGKEKRILDELVGSRKLKKIEYQSKVYYRTERRT